MSHFLIDALDTKEPCGLWVDRTGRWLATHLELALDSEARTRGLLGRDGLPAGHGLVIAPSQGVHTFGMRFPIDIVFVRRDGRVVRCRPGVPPRRIALWLTAFAVVELAAGEAGRAGLVVGDRLRVRRHDVCYDDSI